MKMIYREELRERLARRENPDECWLLCDVCQRFFQYKSARPSGMFARDACPMSDCYGTDLSFSMFMWDDLREPLDPRWPTCVDELKHGMKAPDMEQFYRAQLTKRIDAMVSACAGSAEMRSFGGEPRFVAAFLNMAAALCWDLTDEDDDDDFDAVLAREILADLPMWSDMSDVDEAPSMTAELRSFFRFADRTDGVWNASKWLQLVEGDDITEMFVHTMERVRHMRPVRTPLRHLRTKRRPSTHMAVKPKHDPRAGMRKPKKRPRRAR